MSNPQQTRNYLKPQEQELTDPDSIAYYLQGFYLKHRSQRHSPRTIEWYAENLEPFVWFQKQNGYSLVLREITPNHIRLFLIYLQDEQGGRWGKEQWNTKKALAPATLHGYARCLRTFFRWATKEAGLNVNPFSNIDMPTIPNQWKVQTFTDDEIVALFAACNIDNQPFTTQRNRAILAVLLDSGIRAAELLNLKLNDIDPKEALFTVRGKGNKVRTVVLGSYSRRELWAYLAHFRLKLESADPALFVSKLGVALKYNGLKEMFRRLKQRTGITRVSIRAHNCRHTFATIAHRNGMRGATLQEVLGHTQFDTTRRYYLDISKDDLKLEHSLYGPLDKMGRTLASTRTVRSASSTNSGTDASVAFPNPDILAKEVSETSYRAVARKYGVSDTTIRKRLKKAGLL